MITRRRILAISGAAVICGPLKAETIDNPSVGLPLGFSDISNRQVIPDFHCLPGAINLVVIGQSNAANTNVDDGYLPPDEVTNINPYDRHVYKARDPLLGASVGNPPFTGGFSTRLAGLLVNRALVPQVNILNIAIGSSSIERWTETGSLHPRIPWAGEALKSLGLRATFILQHLGEFDGAYATPALIFAERQRDVVRSFRESGMDCPYFVAQVARMIGLTKPEAEAEVHRGQILACDPTLNIFPGPNTDVLGQEYRGDPGHFLASGAQRHAEMWFDILKAYLRT